MPLLDVIRQSLVDFADANPTVKGQAIKTASVISQSLVSLLSGLSFKLGIPGAADLSFDANKAISKAREFGGEEREARTPRSFYHASFCALKEAFAEFTGQGQRRVVVFIDDLDRCLPEGALQVLESMKLFFDFDGFIFVVGLDKAVVEAAIDVRYANHHRDGATPAGGFRVRGADYIKKIFQVPFALPAVLPANVDEFVDAVALQETLTAEQLDNLETLKWHLRYVATDAGLNPREIKRYINAFWIIRAVKPELGDEDAILALLTLEFRPDWQLVQEGISAYRETFLAALHDRVTNGNADPLSHIDPRFEGIPLSFFEYVSDGGPARSLLQVNPIIDYLYASAGTQAERGSLRSLEVIRAIGALRTPLGRLLVPGEGGNPPDGALFRRAIEEVKGSFADQASAHPLMQNSIERTLLRLSSEIEGILRSKEREERQQWVDRWNAWITQTIAHLSRGTPSSGYPQ